MNSMAIFNMLRGITFNMDPGPNENSKLWKLLNDYQKNKEESTVTLEEVLEDSEVLSFLQHNHQPLIEFLKEKEHFEKLVKYIVSSPEDKFVYSEKSSKILTHTQNTLREHFFNDVTTNFDILFGLSEGDSNSSTLINIDSRNSNLLGQLVQKLLSTNEFKVVEYFSSKQIFAEKFDLFFSAPALLLSFIDPNICYETSSLASWLESVKFIEKLVEAFSGKFGENAILTASDVLSSIGNNSYFFKHIDSPLFTSNLLNTVINSSECKDEAESKSIIVLNSLAERFKFEGCLSVPTSLGPIIQKLDFLNSLLLPGGIEITNTTGKINSFGMKRMNVVHLIQSLVFITSESITSALLDSQIFNSLFEAFFTYKWNNILQTTIFAICLQIFQLDNSELTSKLLQNTNLVERISSNLLIDIQAASQNQSLAPYNGVLIEFQTHLNTLADGELKSFFDNSPSWQLLHTPENEDLESGIVADEVPESQQQPAEEGVVDSNDADQDVIVSDAPVESQESVSSDSPSQTDSSVESGESQEPTKEESQEVVVSDVSAESQESVSSDSPSQSDSPAAEEKNVEVANTEAMEIEQPVTHDAPMEDSA